MNPLTRATARFGLALALAGGILGCAGVVNLAGPTDDRILIHSWRQVTWKPLQAWEGPTSGMYTYVLIGDVSRSSTDPSSERARGALRRLLLLIATTDPVSTSAADFPAVIAARMNQFCIPTRKDLPPSAPMTLDRYDTELAAQYRHWFQATTANDPALSNVLNGPGPYLVATRQPLAELIQEERGQPAVRTDSPVLVMDMSNRDAGAVPYFLDAFKDAVASTQPGSAKLEPMKPVIVSVLTSAGVGLPLLAEFWSKSRKLFLPEKTT